MSELPPDPTRLRVILEHLEQQVADNETVGIYLRLQRDTVRAALTQAESSRPPRDEAPRPPPALAAPPTTHNRRRPTKPFKLERVRTPEGPLPTGVHTADCHMAGSLAQPVNAMEARLAITDAGLNVCEFCQPEIELGFDAD